MKKYTVEFKYYQYNSGMGDNGTYTLTESFETLEEAKEFKRKIDEAYDSKDDSESESSKWYSEYIQDNTSYGGPLRSRAKIFEITKTEIL
jgi:hypothetical protein